MTTSPRDADLATEVDHFDKQKHFSEVLFQLGNMLANFDVLQVS